tara:strand:+ start:81 stop:2573 length:2493 start_codon:yes stop_codon:yes gene_type:complete
MLRLTTILEGLNIPEPQLLEDKLYGRKVIDATTNRIGDKSEDTLNKLAIAGLFRDYFGNIQQLNNKDQLDSVFKKWYDGMLGKMVKTKAFADNRSNAKRYLDAYIGNVRELGDSARRFSFKKIESGLVDLVNNKKWLESGIVSTKSGIYEPDSEDIVHEDDNVLVLDSKTKAKCVKYGSGESWCIGKPELNYYNTYRLSYGATPYHVLQKNVDGDEHKLVIMNYGDRGYAIADRSNSGKRHGGSGSAMSWSNIETEIPNLKGMEKYFPYRNITNEERNYGSVLRRKYTNDNLQRYIEDITRDLVVNDSNVTPEDFIRDYVANNHAISNSQINSLNDTIKDSLIESGYFLSAGEGQTDLLNDRQLRRIIRLKLENGKSLTDSEFEIVKGDEPLMVIYRKSVKDKYDRFMDATSGWGRKNHQLSYTELLTLDDNSIRKYVKTMSNSNTTSFLLKYGMDKTKFLENYGSTSIFDSEQQETNKLIRLASSGNDKALERLNSYLPDNIEVTFFDDKIEFDGIDTASIDNDIRYFIDRISDDRWDDGYYDYYDGDDARLIEDYKHYLESTLSNQGFREKIESYGIAPTVEAVDNVFDEKELKADILNRISEVVNEASFEAKQEKWSEIVSKASDLLVLSTNYRGDGSITMQLNAFILNGGYDMFNPDGDYDFYSELDSVLDDFLDIYDDDSLPSNEDEIWETIDDGQMAPDTQNIIDFIESQADDIVEDDDMDYDEEDVDGDSKGKKVEVIQALRDTLKGLKQPEMATSIDNDLVDIKFDRQRFKMDGSVYVDMFDKKRNKGYDGFIKIADIPTYFTNYKLFEGRLRIKTRLRKFF